MSNIAQSPETEVSRPMTSDSAPPFPVPVIPPPPEEEMALPQVLFKAEDGRLLLFLPPEPENSNSAHWSDNWEQLKHLLNGGDRFWQPQTEVHLMAQDRLLDSRQLQAIADALLEFQLQLKRVYTNRRQTAVAAATAGYSVEQIAPAATLNQSIQPVSPLANPLYLQSTLRSGMEIRHSGTVVVLGDINPGGCIVAAGDILVWGRLRGVAHAGCQGNAQALIMALQMEPTQLRIADYVARAPEPPIQFYPEIAYVTTEGIRLAKAADFPKANFGKSFES
jgi:septum site-determining protein MinC